ncbi:MAG: hypothetical protein HYT15_01230 [Candidatus Magasanikbacteria bacterium]|nr:hypothetical protein [Candidatus Magasanikbacteria bacterium]
MDKKERHENLVIKKSLEEMQREIAKEDKIGLQIPKDLRPGDEFTVLNDFLDAMKIKKAEQFKPEDIIFYSKELGILKFNYKSDLHDDTFIIENIPTTIYSWADAGKENALQVSYYHSDNVFDVVSITKNGVKTEL